MISRFNKKKIAECALIARTHLYKDVLHISRIKNLNPALYYWTTFSEQVWNGIEFKTTARIQNSLLQKVCFFSILIYNIISSSEQRVGYLCLPLLADVPPALWMLPDDGRHSGMTELRLTSPGQTSAWKQNILMALNICQIKKWFSFLEGQYIYPDNSTQS